MSQLVLITGGVKSGKSSFAVSLAKKMGEEVVFVATAKPIDEEMRKKIKAHQESRPSHWKTVEVSESLLEEIKHLRGEVFVLDCLTLYLSQLLVSKTSLNEEHILDEILKTLKVVKKNFSFSIFVTNEVGSGVVPENYLGRRFTEVLGKVNQLVASHSDQVFLLISGIPLKVKGDLGSRNDFLK